VSSSALACRARRYRNCRRSAARTFFLQFISLSHTYPQASPIGNCDYALTAAHAKNIIGSLCSINFKRVPRCRFWGSRDEENLSTEPHQAGQDPRFPRTHGHTKWAQNPEGTPRQGTWAPGDLIDHLSPGKPVNTRFKRQARLCRPGDFRDVFAKPKKSVDSFFTVLARDNGRSSARLGLAISKKCARRAVDRNRLKRIVRESYRHHRDHLKGIDFVVLCRRGSLTSPNSRLFSSLSAHWKRIRDQLCAS